MKAIKTFFTVSLLGGLIVMVSVSLPISLVGVLLDTIAIFTGPLVKMLVGNAAVGLPNTRDC